jgi:hypothetical protein
VANVAFNTGVLAERQRWLKAIQEVTTHGECFCEDSRFRNEHPYVYVADLMTVLDINQPDSAGFTGPNTQEEKK